MGRGLGTLALVATVLVCCAAPRYFHARARTRSGLPVRDYVFEAFAQPITAWSMSGVPVPPFVTPPELAPTEALAARADTELRVFQFIDERLAIDHCSISRIAVQLHRNGDCTVSFRADQNPQPPAPTLGPPSLSTVVPPQVAPNVTTTAPVLNPKLNVTTEQPTNKYTLHLRRNEFYVQFRCYGLAGAPMISTPLGKPVMAEIVIPPFWVERGEPYQMMYRCHSNEIKKNFLLIDRVELEFTYRLAQSAKTFQ